MDDLGGRDPREAEPTTPGRIVDASKLDLAAAERAALDLLRAIGADVRRGTMVEAGGAGALTVSVVIPVRHVFKLHNIITTKHLENAAKLVMVTGWIVAYGYMLEWFFAWYSGDAAEMYQAFVARPLGPNAIVFYLSMICNVLI